MPIETIGEKVVVRINSHPVRKDSAQYVESRKWLKTSVSGCFVCGDTTATFQDHHGGGLYHVQGNTNKLIGFNLFGLEWSLGWNANPTVVQDYVTSSNQVNELLGFDQYIASIKVTKDVMNYLDSEFNANVKLCPAHHVGEEDKDTKDINGNQGVGIHFTPFPIWLGQVTCDWKEIDMWAGTPGTAAVYRQTVKGKKTVGVVHMSPLHKDSSLVEEHRKQIKDTGSHILDPEHELTKAALKKG